MTAYLDIIILLKSIEEKTSLNSCVVSMMTDNSCWIANISEFLNFLNFYYNTLEILKFFPSKKIWISSFTQVFALANLDIVLLDLQYHCW